MHKVTKRARAFSIFIMPNISCCAFFSAAPAFQSTGVSFLFLRSHHHAANPLCSVLAHRTTCFSLPRYRHILQILCVRLPLPSPSSIHLHKLFHVAVESSPCLPSNPFRKLRFFPLPFAPASLPLIYTCAAYKAVKKPKVEFLYTSQILTRITGMESKQGRRTA